MIKDKEKKIVNERRRSPRVRGGFNIEIANFETKIIADTINISSSGIYCQSSQPIPLFREIELNIMLPNIKKPIDCAGVVVRSEKAPSKDRYNIAVFFNDISPEDKKQLSAYIEKRLAG